MARLFTGVRTKEMDHEQNEFQLSCTSLACPDRPADPGALRAGELCNRGGYGNRPQQRHDCRSDDHCHPTNQTYTTTSNASGIYNLPFLPVGTYTLSANFAGFQTVEIDKFELAVGQTARVDIQMKVGQVTEKVVVEASSIGLQTENAAVGTVIDREQVAELPLNGRSFVQLALLTPGVNPGTPGSLSMRSAGGSLGQNVGMSANGSRDNQNRFHYDGIESMSLGSYSMSFSLSIDAIREFKVDSSSYSAAYGAAPGGHVNLTTKSGSNEFHGQA